MQTLWQDLRYTARQFWKRRYYFIAVLTMTVSLGTKAGQAVVSIASAQVAPQPSYRTALELTDYNLLFTRVKINGQEARALIDSGSFRAIQLSSTLAQTLQLPLTKTNKVAKRYEGKELYLMSSRLDRLAIGDYAQREVTVEVIEGDIENIAAQVGTKFDVILGWGFLSQFHTLLNYPQLSMQFSVQPPATGTSAFSLKYSVVNGVPVVRGTLGNQEVSLLLDTGAPMCSLDLAAAGVPKGAKVSKEVVLAQRRLPLEFRAKDLTVIKQSLGCVGVIGNNFLRQYTVYFDPGNKVVHLASQRKGEQ